MSVAADPFSRRAGPAGGERGAPFEMRPPRSLPEIPGRGDSLGPRRALAGFAGALLCGLLGLAAAEGPQRIEKRMGKTAFVYHPDYLLHDPGAAHPERPDRLRALTAHLKKTGLLEELLQIEPDPAEESWIARVHPPEYIRLIERASKQAPTALDPDTRVSSGSFRAAVLAVGGALAAVDAVLQGRAKNAFAAVRPPGHHALPARAMGFCLFNNVAVAARYAQAKYGLRRVLIVDWDVHHGNGTQAIFWTDPTVLYFSTHQYPFYPGTGSEEETGAGPGEGTVVNAPLPAGAGDAEVIRAFQEKLIPAADAFRPEFVLISAGFDGHRRDPLAMLQLTERGFAELTRIVLDIARRHAGGRVVSVLEGGYDLEALSRSVEAHLRVLSGLEEGAAPPPGRVTGPPG